MNRIERWLAQRRQPKVPEGMMRAADANRSDRRRSGFRGRLWGGMAPVFLPRYIRRHYTEVMAQPFTWRVAPWAQGRRERKVRSKINRIVAKYDLSAPIS